jgi:hypothetical protein
MDACVGGERPDLGLPPGDPIRRQEKVRDEMGEVQARYS